MLSAHSQWQMFLLTQAIEVPIAMLLSRQWSIAPIRSAPAALVASCLTHPFVWMANQASAPLLAHAGLAAYWLLWCALFLVLESGAILAEAAWYRYALRASTTRCLILSAIANASSFGIGLALYFSGFIA